MAGEAKDGAGASEGSGDKAPVPKKKKKREIDLPSRIHTWPYLVRLEFLAALIVMIVITVWSITIDAPTEQWANPNRTPNPSKAPWYFLGLQEMLVYFDPWFAGVWYGDTARRIGDQRDIGGARCLFLDPPRISRVSAMRFERGF